LSTFLLPTPTGLKVVAQPVDKSVVKLWKDSAKGRNYWRGAIASVTGRSHRPMLATLVSAQVKQKTFKSARKAL
jgi:hypothetical protein